MDEARERLTRAMQTVGGEVKDWTALESLVDPDTLDSDLPKSSVQASTLLAGLELAKEGVVELRQSRAFTPIYLRTNQHRTPA